MIRPKMSLLDVCKDLRSRGMHVNQKTVSEGITQGAFPFGRILRVSPNGRKTFLILGREYERWADENIGPVRNDRTEGTDGEAYTVR